MPIFGVIIIDIFIAILGLFSVQGIWLMVKFFSFEVPFTNKLIALGVIKKDIKSQLLFVDLFSKLITIILGNGICVLLAGFVEPSGYIVYGITAFVTLLFFRPTKENYSWSSENIVKYISRHSICMDMKKLKEYMDCDF